MVSTVLGLRFEVKYRHFQKGEMRLRCTATLSEVMRMESDPLEAEISERHISDWLMDFNKASGMNCILSILLTVGYYFNISDDNTGHT